MEDKTEVDGYGVFRNLWTVESWLRVIGDYSVVEHGTAESHRKVGLGKEFFAVVERGG